MKLSLFSLGAEETIAIKESQVAIENAFHQILDEPYKFTNFTNEKLFLTELSTAVARDSMIVAAAEPQYFKAFKSFICNAFQLKCKPSKTVIGLVQFVHPELTDDIVEEHANIPSGATPLVSQDGLYSGFGIKAKNQLLIVLPLDDKRIDYIINNSLMQFVRENMDMSILTSDPLSGMEDVESPLAAREESVRRNGELYDRQLIASTVQKLREKGLTVAIANTKTLDFIGNISTTAIDLSEVLFVSGYSTEKGEMTAREFAINLAKGALLNSKNSIGATVTKVFTVTDEKGKQQFFMYACIADGENANVAKLTAEEGETPPQLIYRAIEELFRMLNVWADTGYAIPQNGDVVVVRPTNVAKKNASFLNKVKIATGAIIAAGSIGSVLISLLVNNVYGVL